MYGPISKPIPNQQIAGCTEDDITSKIFKIYVKQHYFM